ncbi:MAG: exo-beta-N-acetylmuramidase NamZ family protein [Bdellovibrionota bacterium]
MKLGIEVFLADKKRLKALKGKRVALVCHPASVDHSMRHSFDLLHAKVGLSAAFGPQHGAKGDKQYNMVESDDVIDPDTGVPIFSLYGKVRRPTREMMETFDVLVYDLQDLGCRIYTFATTLLYVMEECAKAGKKLIVLDRPNPAGREIEGFRLEKGWESFVGASTMPMRHGLTMGELALYYKHSFNLGIDLEIVKMQGYQIGKKPGFGWPEDLSWVNPSPNAPSLNMARAYPGTVMIEGTNLSEGRGTTRSLEVVGAAEIDFRAIHALMKKKAPKWLKGALLRECYFEPTFYKYQGKLCSGLQIHTDNLAYKPAQFKPYRLVALLLKCIRELHPSYDLYRDFAYEYVFDKLAFHVINGGPKLKDWIDDPSSTPAQLDRALQADEKSWARETRKFLLYK